MISLVFNFVKIIMKLKIILNPFRGLLRYDCSFFHYLNFDKIFILCNNIKWSNLIHPISELRLLLQSNHTWLQGLINSLSFLFQFHIDYLKYKLRSNPYRILSISMSTHLHISYLLIHFIFLLSNYIPSIDVKYVLLKFFKLNLLISSLNNNSSCLKQSAFWELIFLCSVEICLAFDISSDDMILFCLHSQISKHSLELLWININ